MVRLDLACSQCSNHGRARCPPGTHECMQALPLETVMESVREVLRS